MTPIAALQAYCEPGNRCLKTRKRNTRSILAPETGRNCSDWFFRLNDDFLAQDRPRELKLVSLKPPGNEDFE